MRITTFTEAIWPCIRETLDYLAEQRGDSVPKLVEAGLNFSIVLGAACYVEGVLESLLRSLLACRRAELNRIQIDDTRSWRPMNLFYERLEDELSRNIGRAVGAQGYDEMFNLLTGKRLSQLTEVVPLWEAVAVLFNFRNVLGHGRQVSARHFEVSGPGGIKEDFPGAYKAVEAYLQKKKLLLRRFVDVHNEYVFLSAAIADHFLTLAKALPTAIMASLPDEEQSACRRGLEEVESATPK